MSLVSSQHHKFESLDGLRGILALLVAFIHLPILWHLYDSAPLRYGYFAVDFFFILSGFVITHASLPALSDIKSGGVFMLRRFGRVWPLHAFVLGMFILNELAKLWTTSNTTISGQHEAFANTNTYALNAIPTNLLLIHSLNIHDKLTWNMPSWSISTEFYTYLLFAVIAVVMRRWLTPMAAVLIVTTMAMLFNWAPSLKVTNDYGILRCIAGFFAGYLIYLVWRRNSNIPLAYPAITEITCVILVCSFAYATGDNKLSILAPLVLTLPIWVFAYQQGPLSKVLQSRPLQLLGLLSYSIYITHNFLLVCFKRALYALEKILHTSFQIDYLHHGQTEPYSVFTFGNPWLMDIVTLLYLISVIITAWLATRFIETPARDAINKLARKWQGSQPQK